MQEFWDGLVAFIKAIEPLILVVIPVIWGILLKLKTKVNKETLKVKIEIENKNKQKLLDWRHEESIRVITKLKEVCNYHCDLSHIHTSYIQLENGTIATSKLCNMFFSCIAEDNRYSNLNKLIKIVQRVPFIRLSSWFNKLYSSSHQVVYITEREDIDDVLYDDVGVRCVLSSLVRDPNGLIIGACNFVFSEEQNVDDLDEYNTQMIKFVSSVETIFLDYNINLKNKAKELGFSESEV